jgi:hypothetical protein
MLRPVLACACLALARGYASAPPHRSGVARRSALHAATKGSFGGWKSKPELPPALAESLRQLDAADAAAAAPPAPAPRPRPSRKKAPSGPPVTAASMTDAERLELRKLGKRAEMRNSRKMTTISTVLNAKTDDALWRSASKPNFDLEKKARTSLPRATEPEPEPLSPEEAARRRDEAQRAFGKQRVYMCATHVALSGAAAGATYAVTADVSAAQSVVYGAAFGLAYIVLLGKATAGVGGGDGLLGRLTSGASGARNILAAPMLAGVAKSGALLPLPAICGYFSYLASLGVYYAGADLVRRQGSG